jgi:uncharacterized membrane protein
VSVHCTARHKENTVSQDHVADYVTLAAAYSTLPEAEADYDAIKKLYYDDDMMDTFDAAVITRSGDGTVKIVREHEEPTRHAGWAGAGIGLAVGVVAALFPGAAVAAALLLGAGAGAIIGAVAGHVTEGMDRKDLKDIGELLAKGQSGLVVVAATDETARVEGSFSHAATVMRKNMKADREQLRAAVEQATAPESAKAN